MDFVRRYSVYYNFVAASKEGFKIIYPLSSPHLCVMEIVSPKIVASKHPILRLRTNVEFLSSIQVCHSRAYRNCNIYPGLAALALGTVPGELDDWAI